MQGENMQGLINSSQLAEYLGCHRDTARITTRQAGFPVPVLIGKRKYWSKLAVMSFYAGIKPPQ